MELSQCLHYYFPNQRKLFFGVLTIAGTMFLLMTAVFNNVLREPCQKFPPKAICFGVTKSGTGALRMFLGAHPEIDIAPAKTPDLGLWEKPSVSFFDLHYEEGLDWYLNKMPCSKPNKIIIDHTPQYFKKNFVPRRIYMFNSTIRLLLVLREPISRTVSHYLQMKDMRPNFDQSLDIETFLMDESGKRIDIENPAVSMSAYILYLKKWLSIFNLDQIYIVDGNEFARSPLRQLKEIETFLGIKSFFNSDIVYYNETRGFYCVKMLETDKRFQCGGVKKGRTHPKLTEPTFNQLKEYFEPYNKRLFRLIGKQFNWTLPQ